MYSRIARNLHFQLGGSKKKKEDPRVLGVDILECNVKAYL